MNAAMTMETCPDSETLAAFSDGTLDAKARFEVMPHIADCGRCCFVLAELDAGKHELALEEPDRVARGSFGRWIAPLAAAAAVVVVVFGVPSIRERVFVDPMAKLVEAASYAPKRSTEGRLSGDFEYRLHERLRGKNGAEAPLGDKTALAKTMIESAAHQAALHAETRRSPANLHADGVGKLLMKTPAPAVAVLEEAAKESPRSVAILTDLSAAYQENGDYEKALATATRAWTIEQTPAAAWNRALALDALARAAPSRNSEVAAAWDKYLELDPSSEWAEEVRTKYLPRVRPQG